MDEVHWPPRSPYDALMSSPNGRKKFRDMLDRRNTLQSPNRRENVSPRSSRRSPLSRTSPPRTMEDDIEISDNDDEETLQLKIQTLQAKLRLKQLQKSKKQPSEGGSVSGASDLRPPSTSASTDKPGAKAVDRYKQQRRTASDDYRESIQVPVSPTKKEVPPPEQTSPRRIKLGIDKGMKGSEVSLRRPPIARKESRISPTRTSKPTTSNTSRPRQDPNPISPPRIKSFSERIAESRAADRIKQEKAEKRHQNRSSGFQIDQKEVDHYKEIAEESKPFSPQKSRGMEGYSRADVLKAYNKSEATLRRTQSPTGSDDSQEKIRPGKKFEEPEAKKGDATKFEPFSGLHLSKRILPHSFMKRTLEGKTPMNIPYLLKHVKAPDFELPDTDGDCVIFGVIASKSSPRDHKDKHQTQGEVNMDDDGRNNTKKYMVLTLTDLEWSIDLFLFATAFPRYYKLTPGTVVAILNPNIMAPPADKVDTGKFSLALNSSDDTILEIGKAQDLGFCKSIKKDGSVCDAWVDARKTEFCEYHVDLQVRKATAQRMEVNHGPGAFGPGGRSGSRTGFQGKKGQTGLLDPHGKKFDQATQSTYYVVSRKSNNSGPRFGQSTASMLDAEDPFMHNLTNELRRGNENSEERMRRRLIDKQRERDIAKKLGESSKSIGGEYLRIHHSQTSANTTPASNKNKTPSSVTSSHASLAPSAREFFGDLASSKKTAGAVKLGRAQKRSFEPASGSNKTPDTVKKTRFITAKGIKDAGVDITMSTVHEDYDDDLDIV